MRLIVIVTDNLSRTAAELSQLVLIFGHFAFLSHTFLGGGLSDSTYDVYLGLIGKRVVDFLLVIIELFSLDVTAEARYERK